MAVNLASLRSSQQPVVARALSDLLFDAIRRQNDLGGEPVARALGLLREAVLPASPQAVLPSKEDREHLTAEIFSVLTPAQKQQFLDGYARLGHLYELAGLQARSNYFREIGRPPGGVEEFLEHPRQGSASVQRTVEQLGKPVFEVVMTMHPTNTNSLESMQAQRALGKALEVTVETGGSAAALEETVARYARTPLVPNKQGKDANLTVRDETETVLYFLGNIYDDLPRVYQRYDEALNRKFGAEYDPLSLKLNMRLGSWGSAGDKDGNNSVYAENTLEAAALHKYAILTRYLADLNRCPVSPQLAPWQQQLTLCKGQLEKLLPEITALREASERGRRGEAAPEHANETFDRLSESLSKISPDAKAFTHALEDAYAAETQGERKAPLRDLICKARTFGFTFAKIEYRETAEEYTRVAEELLRDVVPDYADRVKNGTATKALTDLLVQYHDRPDELAQKLKPALDRIFRDGANRSYSDQDALPIAYHTLKRMQLARDHPDMIRDNVLAECEGVHHILEAQLLQMAAANQKGRPLLGIVPLFEKPEIMQRIDHIMEEAYQNPAYRLQMMDLATDRYEGKRTQQVQIAHSDNARRSGAPAARALIHEAHEKLRALNAREGIATQFFEGGSISDAYRNGVRAVSASVNAFGLHDFAKFTYQGGDLLNYFNQSNSIERVFTRNIVSPAEKFVYTPQAGWHLEPKKSAGENSYNPIANAVAIKALERTLTDYEHDDFRHDDPSQNKMGALLAALDYDLVSRFTNYSSRASARGPVAFKPSAAVAVGKIRTIPFSTTFQYAGIVPSWIGAQNLRSYVGEEIERKVAQLSVRNQLDDNEKEFMKLFGTIKETGLRPGHVRQLYTHSPAFRDAEDFMPYAVAMTEPGVLENLTRTLPDGLAKNYAKTLQTTLYQAGEMALAAQGVDGVSEQWQAHINNREMRDKVTDSLVRLGDAIKIKRAFREPLLTMKNILLGGSEPSEERDHMLRLHYNGLGTVVHGRFLGADDPALGAYRAEHETRQAVAR